MDDLGEIIRRPVINYMKCLIISVQVPSWLLLTPNIGLNLSSASATVDNTLVSPSDLATLQRETAALWNWTLASARLSIIHGGVAVWRRLSAPVVGAFAAGANKLLAFLSDVPLWPMTIGLKHKHKSSDYCLRVNNLTSHPPPNPTPTKKKKALPFGLIF